MLATGLILIILHLHAIDLFFRQIRKPELAAAMFDYFDYCDF